MEADFDGVLPHWSHVLGRRLQCKGRYLAFGKQRSLCFKVLSHSLFVTSALFLHARLALTHKRLVLPYSSPHSGAMVKISTNFAASILPTHQNTSPCHTGYGAQQPPNQSWISNQEEGKNGPRQRHRLSSGQHSTL